MQQTCCGRGRASSRGALLSNSARGDLRRHACGVTRSWQDGASRRRHPLLFVSLHALGLEDGAAGAGDLGRGALRWAMSRAHGLPTVQGIRAHAPPQSSRVVTVAAALMALAFALVGLKLYMGNRDAGSAPTYLAGPAPSCPAPVASPVEPAGYFDMSFIKRTMRKPGQKFMVLTDFLLECAAAPGCLNQGPTKPLGYDEVIYIVLTGSASQNDRLPALVQDWGSKVKLMGFSDVADASLKVYTFPEIQGTPGWDEAQHRQPKGLQWLMREPQYSEYKVGEAKWFVFIDDDTWINYQALHGALARINSNTRLAMGYIWHQVYSDFDHYSGGSGIVVSAPAAQEMARRLYKGGVPPAGRERPCLERRVSV